MEQDRSLSTLRGKMRSFLQVGFFDDPVILARELRSLRAEMTRVIAALEVPSVPPPPLPPAEEVTV